MPPIELTPDAIRFSCGGCFGERTATIAVPMIWLWPASPGDRDFWSAPPFEYSGAVSLEIHGDGESLAVIPLDGERRNGADFAAVLTAALTGAGIDQVSIAVEGRAVRVEADPQRVGSLAIVAPGLHVEAAQARGLRVGVNIGGRVAQDVISLAACPECGTYDAWLGTRDVIPVSDEREHGYHGQVKRTCNRIVQMLIDGGRGDHTQGQPFAEIAPSPRLDRAVVTRRLQLEDVASKASTRVFRGFEDEPLPNPHGK